MDAREIFRAGNGVREWKRRDKTLPESPIFEVTHQPDKDRLTFWIDLDGYDNNAVFDLDCTQVRQLCGALNDWLDSKASAED